MERQLLARSRFFNNSDVNLDELLQQRYSRSGSQKDFLILNPTAWKDENNQKEKSLLHGLGSAEMIEEDDENGKVKKLRDFPTNKVGKLDPNTDWETKYSPILQQKAERFIKKLEKKNPNKKLPKKPPKFLIKQYDSILAKRNKSTPRLAFREYIKTMKKNQRSIELKSSKTFKESPIINPDLLKKSIDIEVKALSIPQYSDYFNIHELWQQYIQDLLKNETSAQQILSKLSTAEYIGSIVRIVKSSNKELLNLTGLVIYEYKNFFLLVIPNGMKYGANISITDQLNYLEDYEDNKLFNDTKLRFKFKELIGGIRMIEKKSCIFKILLPIPNNNKQQQSLQLKDKELQLNYKDENLAEFLVIGGRFNYKTTDRANKKFKSHGVDDLGFLIEK